MNLKIVTIFLIFCIIMGVSSQVDEETNIVSAKCLQCICVASSGCNLDLKCDGSVCGPYGITLGFWIDAGRPTVKDNCSKVEDGDNTDDTEYRNCSNDQECAARAIEAYMQRYKKDCNADDEINCDDFIRIHRLGPFGCTKTLDKNFEKAYIKCMNNNAI